MSEVYKAVKVSEHVWWVGAIDYSVRDFHGYRTARGSTYNAYLINADAPILIDTVKAPFKDEMLARVASVIGDPANVRYIVSNHAEMDHSGSLPATMAAVMPEKVFASKLGVQALSEHFEIPGEIIPLESGKPLKVGGVTLTPFETRMLHWPDSMVTYVAEDKLLFSQDGFGMHLASSERFADEIDESLLEEEGARYFANILLPFSPIVKKVLESILATGWDIQVIAPDHGPIWREKLDWIIGLYAKWADQKPAKKAVVVFDTMWQSTAAMARAIGEGLAEGGAEVKFLNVRFDHRSDVAAEMLDAGALLVGSPTLNNGLFPTVADVLTYIKGLKPLNKIGAAFGSYGWSGEAVALIEKELAEMKVELVADSLKVKYVPKPQDLEKCRALGVDVAQRLG